MELHTSTVYTRREFLQGLTFASAALAVPSFLQASALGLPTADAGLSSIPGVPEDHILVVVQLSGGNDRYMDSECCGYGKGESGTPEPNGTGGGAGDTAPGIAIGRTAPLAMQGQKVKPVAFENADLFRWTAAEINKPLGEGYQAIN